eukprot:PITA_30361
MLQLELISNIAKFMKDLPKGDGAEKDEKVILVGHSMGGMNLTCMMEQFPHRIAVAVFVTAFIPVPGATPLQLIDEDIKLVDCLIRNMPALDEEVISNSENYGIVPRAYIVAKQDKEIIEERQRKMIVDNPLVRVYEWEESDHSPFFSFPVRLAQILDEISNSFD